MCNQGTCVNQDRVSPGDPAYVCTCHEGYYIPSSAGSSACTEQCSADCNVGEYRLNCGGSSHSTSGGSCVSCTNLADGSYFSGSGGFTDTCAQTSCDTASCVAGEYLSGCTGSNAGTCIPCTGLSAGEYWTSNGGRTDSCQKSSCLTDCGEGNYRQGCGNTSPGSCTSCVADCGVGNYRQGCENLSEGTCTTCASDCGSSQFRLGCGDLEEGTCTACDTNSCAAGQYLNGCSNLEAGACVECTNKPSTGNYYYSSNGGLVDACQYLVCETGCGVGSYRHGCEGASAGACTTCSNAPDASKLSLSVVFERGVRARSASDFEREAREVHFLIFVKRSKFIFSSSSLKLIFSQLERHFSSFSPRKDTRTHTRTYTRTHTQT